MIGKYHKCQTCGAEAGMPCVTKYNTEASHAHKYRVEMTREERREHQRRRREALRAWMDGREV